MFPPTPILTALRSTNSPITSSYLLSPVGFVERKAATVASWFTAGNSCRGKDLHAQARAVAAEPGKQRACATWRRQQSPGCIMRSEGSFRSDMLPHAYPLTGGRRLFCWRSLLLWLCAFSLLLVLANRVPRFPRSETSWVRSVPSQMTVKLLAKHFYLLQPPASGIFTLLRSIPARRAAEEAHPVFPVSLDNCLYTRPPPTS